MNEGWYPGWSLPRWAAIVPPGGRRKWAIITSRVGCRTWSEEVPERGYLESRTAHFQEFYRAWFVFGVRVALFVLFTEEVPVWARVQSATLGFTGWRSKAPQWMHDEAKKNARR